MNFNDKNLSYLAAVNAALEATQLSVSEARFLLAERQDGLYHLVFRTDWMKYEAYVSTETGLLLGLDYEPSVDSERLPCRYEFPAPRFCEETLSA